MTTEFDFKEWCSKLQKYIIDGEDDIFYFLLNEFSE